MNRIEYAYGLDISNLKTGAMSGSGMTFLSSLKLDKTNQMEDAMSDEMVVRQCAPTLASIKTGSLFNAPFDTREKMQQSIRRLNQMLKAYGIRVLPLRWKDGKELIYLYRPSRLARDLQDKTAQKLLRECGYTCSDPDQCICNLIMRLSRGNEFPHEIGLFLGYPPKDVEGFMHSRDDCLLCGLWKVYDNPEGAQEQFRKCRACTSILLSRLQSGSRLDQLAVGS